MRVGKVEQILGPVVDVRFRDEDGYPNIEHALVVPLEDEELGPEVYDITRDDILVLEVLLHPSS